MHLKHFNSLPTPALPGVSTGGDPRLKFNNPFRYLPKAGRAKRDATEDHRLVSRKATSFDSE